MDLADEAYEPMNYVESFEISSIRTDYLTVDLVFAYPD
jgi:hypothetical protein